MNFRKLLVASMLTLGICTAMAQTPPGPGPVPGAGPGAGPGQRMSPEERQKYCQANPERCAQASENAEKRRAEWKQKCEADPKACEEKKAQIQQRREEMKKKCEACLLYTSRCV